MRGSTKVKCYRARKMKVQVGGMELQIPEAVRSGPAKDRAIAAGELIDHLAVVSSELSRIRREALEEMSADGLTKAVIAREIGKDPSRVSRILSKGTPPERALLSPQGEPVTVALGSKLETGRANPSDMISRDAANSYDQIRDALGTYGVSCSREVVPSPGLVDLNRDNLIVIGSPKVLPLLSQVLGADPVYAFAEDDYGRHLINRNTGQVYRSPSDMGRNADYAYIGRLPRPDGQGTFLYLAGIHAPGTNGAAQYLIDNLSELYRTVRGRRFSVLIEADYDDSRDRNITDTRVLADLQLHH